MTDDSQDRHEAFMGTARTLRARGETIDSMLAVLRERSATELESIKVLCKLEGFTLGEAKDAIHNSDAWADLRNTHERLQDTAVEVLRESVRVDETDGKYKAVIDLTGSDQTPPGRQ